MNSKSSFNILIMPCNTPYNALCDPMKNCTHNYNTYLFILTHLESALKHMTNKPSIFMLTIIYEEILWITMYIISTFIIHRTWRFKVNCWFLSIYLFLQLVFLLLQKTPFSELQVYIWLVWEKKEWIAMYLKIARYKLWNVRN